MQLAQCSDERRRLSCVFVTMIEARMPMIHDPILFPDQDVPDDEGRAADGEHAGGLHQEPDSPGREQ